jgi:hypothetical protein
MKRIFIGALVAAAASTATAAASPFGADYGLGEADGIVESVREVPPGKYPAGLAEVFEHAINPKTAQELVVRLGDERAIVVVQDGPRHFQPGQRVLVVRDADGTRVEGA